MASDRLIHQHENHCKSSDDTGFRRLLGTSKTGFVLICCAIVAAALTRLIPHPFNFTPVGAMALFAGANIRNRPLAFIVPLAAMALSDAFLPHDDLRMHVVIYATFAVMVVLGMLLGYTRASMLSRIPSGRSPLAADRVRRMLVSILCVGSFALFTSLLFFTVSNFACWIIYPFYDQTPAGLAACFTAAIPFFGNTLAGDLFYSFVLFGGFALAQQFAAVLQRRTVTAV